MNIEDNEILLQVLSEVFEGFAFMFVEEETDPEEGGQAENLRSRICFNGKNQKGFLEILSPAGFCNDLAENILGTESESLPPDAGENALKEVVNVACGSLLAEKFGTEEVFDLSIPETDRVSLEQWEMFFREGRHTVFLVEEAQILVRFAWQKQNPSSTDILINTDVLS